MAMLNIKLINLLRKHVSDEEYKECISDASKSIAEWIDHEYRVVLYDLSKAICDRIERMR